jgi:AAA domain/Domain of unknown function (DUF3854)
VNLTSEDLAKLATSGISLELVAQARLRRVGSEEGAQIVGRTGAGHYEGLVFPYFWPGEDSPREYRLRRDHPDLELKNGKVKERGKYLSPPGRSNLLYFVPGTPASWLVDPTMPAVLTEGEKKCLALSGLARYGIDDDSARPRWIPIAIGGVWNWRGTIGKTSGPEGDRRDIKGVISDFDRIVWAHRAVTLVFDSNAATNRSVAAARKGLALELASRNAEVYLLDLPKEPSVNGVDDLIGIWGPERVLALFKEARTTKRPRVQQPMAKQFAAPKVLALRDLLQINTRPPELVIAKVLPRRGACLLAGMQKSGKTILAMHSAISVVTGRPLFGCYPVLSPGPAMIIEQDDPDGAASVKPIIQASNVPDSAPLSFVARLPFPLGPRLVEWLEQQIRELGLVLVVMDSYTSLRATRGAGLDIVKSEHAEMTMLDDLGKRTNCLIELIHHESKGSAALDWSAKAGGTYAMTMATESLISICRFPELGQGAPERLVRIRGRHMDDCEMVLSFCRDTLGYARVLEGPAASLYPVLRQLRLEFGSNPFGPKALCQATGISRAGAHRQITALLQAGALTKVRFGEYCVESGSEVVETVAPIGGDNETVAGYPKSDYQSNQ